MKTHTYLVFIVALVLGWGFDYMFWGKAIGINFAIYLTACTLCGVLLLLANGLKPSIKSLGLIVPFLFFASFTFLRQEPLTKFLGYSFSLVSLGLLTVSYQGGRWNRYSLFDYIAKLCRLLASIFALPYVYLKYTKIDTARIRRLPLKPVTRGVLIALPIVIFFAVLLASGDLVFKQKIFDFFRLFDATRIPEYFLRLIIILFWSYVMLGIYLHAALKSQDEKLIGEDKPVIKPFLGFTEATIVLGSVSLLFLVFVIIQFRYFFGGEVNIGVEGFTYSEYARSGFGELITVAVFSLLMILGLGTVTNRESTLKKQIYSGLGVAMALLVMVILVSAYQRLMLAIDWHGFSRLRLYPRVFLVWVGILFMAVIVLEIVHHERFFAFAMLLASIGYAASISVMNVDAAIVRHNVYRTIEGKHFNVNYLTTLSPDAVPELAKAFMDPTLPATIHEGVGAALMCYRQYEEYKNYSSPDWRSFNYSLWAAIRALNRVDKNLSDYTLVGFGDHTEIETPQHDLRYICDE